MLSTLRTCKPRVVELLEAIFNVLIRDNLRGGELVTEAFGGTLFMLSDRKCVICVP
jgi:hypothetical protein